MKEIDKIFSKYLADEFNVIKYYGDKSIVEDFIKVLNENQINEFEAPDAYIAMENEVWILEHFEFDCSKANRKGSKFRIEEYRVNKEAEKIVPTEKGTIFHETYNYDSSYNDYITNLIYNFEKHVSKISNYKKNLIASGLANNNSKFKIVFIIDDVSLFGSVIVGDGGKLEQVTMARMERFLAVFEEETNVDYIFSFSTAGENKCIWVIARESLEAYKEEIVNYEKYRFLNMKPHIIGTSVLVPNK